MRKRESPQGLEKVTVFVTPEQALGRAKSIARKALASSYTVHDGREPLIVFDEGARIGKRNRVIDVADHQPWNRGHEMAPLPTTAGTVPISEVDRKLPSQFAESLDPETRKLLYYTEANGGVKLSGKEAVEIAEAKSENRRAKLTEILNGRQKTTQEVATISEDLTEEAV